MSEAEAFIALPHFLKGVANPHYHVIQNGSRSGGFSYWMEAINYILRTYGTPAEVWNAMSDLWMTRQSTAEDDTVYPARINQAKCLWGNDHSEDEKMTSYADGLMQNIREIVARFLEN